MKSLLLLDFNDYSEDLPIYEKHTVRAIIIKNGLLAMQKSAVGEYKILGGVVEPGESHLETLLREVEEESGLIVKPESLREIGFIEEKRLDVFDREKIYHCYTYFYYCEVEERVVSLRLTACEADKGYTLAWAKPEEIVNTNRSIIKQPWKLRDTEFVSLLAEGKLHD